MAEPTDGTRDGPDGRGLALVAMLLLVAGIGLRVSALDLGWFGVDQARDVATALDIVAGTDLPTIGPSMRRTARLGALYYYVWALPYLVWRDPLAGYWFAAGLGIVALLVVWRLAGRLWGPRAALVTLAVAATHPLWVIDGRVAWSPATLPATGAALLWLLLAPAAGSLSCARAALVGALLGLAVQLHVTMVVWVLAVAVVLALERPAPRVVLAGVGAAFVVGLPAVLALVVGSSDDDGVGRLVAAGVAVGDVGPRARAMVLVGARVTTALSRFGSGDPGGWAVTSAAALASVASVAGVVRLLWREGRGRAARLLAAVLVTGVVLVLLLPGDPWWYYLDGLLPAAALAAGGLVAPVVGPFRRRLLAAVTAVAVVVAIVFGGRLALWLRAVDAHGYLAVEPRLLTLGSEAGADAATPGRMLTVRVQRAFAAAAAAAGGDFESLWRRLHGPALGEVAADNGFWLRWTLAQRAGATDDGGRHVGVWYADDAVAVELARAAAAGALDLEAIGPLRVARYPSVIDYAACRGPAGLVTVPIRAVPHPRRYEDGRPQRPATALPPRITCRVRAGSDAVRLVARVDGPGTVQIQDAGGRAGPVGTESALCLEGAAVPRRFVLVIQQPPDARSALDLYDVPLGVGCGVAPAEIAAVFAPVL
jgi:hypothetical protein